MSVEYSIPEETAAVLREALGREDLQEAAIESLCIAAYRRGTLSTGMLGKLLGIGGVIATDQWLADRDVERPFDIDEHRQQLRDHRRLFPVEEED